jgi:hypothetical protein
MPIPDVIKMNFQTLSKAFENGDIALLECRNSTNGEPAYAICAINILREPDREPNIEMVPIGLMFDHDPYEILIPPTVPELDRPVQPQEAKNILSRKDYLQTQKPSAQKSLERKRK